MKAFLASLVLVLGVSNIYANETIEKSYQEFYTQVCERFIACGNHSDVAEMASLARIKDVKSCMEKMMKRDNARQWKTLLAEKRISYNTKMKSACFSKISTLSCKIISNGIQKPSAIKGCEPFIDGMAEIGASCSKQMECKAAGVVCAGTCQKPPLLECGAELCTEVQACDSKALKCISPKKVGQSCTNFSECESSNCSDGVCGAGAIVSKPGGSCEGHYVCPLGEECDGKICKPY